VSKLTLTAAAAFGLEAVVARELRLLGYGEQQTENGRVLFQAEEEGIARANYWLRAADRVGVLLGEFTADTFDELFEGTKKLSWEEWLTSEACFPVSGVSVKSRLASVPACQAVVKKAIVERLRAAYGVSLLPETGALFSVRVEVRLNRVSLTIDTTGPSLHKRGYRLLTGEAPLKETLAAAMVYLSYWKKDRALLDPFCGAGTIAIEAAWMAQNRAPGLDRRFSAQHWLRPGAAVWQRARTEAKDLWERDLPLRIYGSDIDAGALRLAEAHAQAAGLARKVFFQRLPAREAGSRFDYGYIVTNPPYGRRLAQIPAETCQCYMDLKTLISRLDTWSLNLLTAMPAPERYLGRRWNRSRKLYNGRIECHYYQFFGPKPPRGAGRGR
jgi:putative N6-adenine-specific DNA methylase